MPVITLPSFRSLDLNHFVSHLQALLDTHLEQINQLLAQDVFTWDNIMRPLEDMDDAIERLWSPLSHQHAVVNSPALRECYQACLPIFSAYEAAIGHNQALYQAIKSIDNSSLNNVQQKIIHDALRDFELAGVALSPEKKHRYEAIQTRLADLSNQFENNVLDAEQAFSLTIDDENRLQGLPSHALQTARELAIEKQIDGWVFNLEFPCYQAIVTYAESRELRELFHEAYVTRASEQGPQAHQFDNTDIIDELLALRHEKALLLGFTDYADLSIAPKMAESSEQVLQFLMDLAYRAHGQATEEVKRLRDFAKNNYAIDTIEPWDIAWLSEKMCQQQYAISQEDLRPYFPEYKVINGLFAIIHRLYGISFEKINDVDVWHPDVSCYRLLDNHQNSLGFIYIDLFARASKRGGAWMDSCQSRRLLANGELQLPIATLTCNFAKPAAGKIALLSHDEVITLFHEFGHCLHHLLTRVDYLSASGINGVEWDAVELPSQLFENWCWEREALQLLTEHIDSGELLPEALYDKLIAAKHFQSAMAMMRQLEFSLFDFRIHKECNEQNPELVTNILSDVRTKTTVVPIASYNRFQNSFSHIFAGGYGAGYYSYKWAEVLSSDAYARFEEEGIFNPQTGRDFLQSILEVGSSVKAADAFIAFRGRSATIDALLRHNGIMTTGKSFNN